MTITTSGFYQKNIDLFSRQNKDVSDIQVQVTSGKKNVIAETEFTRNN